MSRIDVWIYLSAIAYGAIPAYLFMASLKCPYRNRGRNVGLLLFLYMVSSIVLASGVLLVGVRMFTIGSVELQTILALKNIVGRSLTMVIVAECCVAWGVLFTERA